MEVNTSKAGSLVHAELERDLNSLLICLEEHERILKNVFDGLDEFENTDVIEGLAAKSGALGRLRMSIHKKQLAICEMTENGTIMSLSEIYQHYFVHYDTDIGEIGAECIRLYQTISHYGNAIKIYLESKGMFYQGFIKNLYNQISPTSTYGSNGELKNGKSGLLVAKSI